MATTLVFLPEEFPGQRSLVGYNPWGHKESEMTEQLTHTHAHTFPLSFCFLTANGVSTRSMS